MKKFLVFLLAFMLIGMAVVAQEEAEESVWTLEPEVTWGFSGSFETQLLKANTTDTFDNSGDPDASFNPFGLNANKFVVSPWIEMDWDRLTVKAEGRYDAFRDDDDDWSEVKITSIWHNLFGFEIKSEVKWDNEDVNDPALAGDPTLVNFGHSVTATLDRLDEEGIKFWAKYDAGEVFALGNITEFGDGLQGIFEDFEELGFELDTDGLGAELVYDNTTMEFGTAWVEARDMFGLWTMLVNTTDAMELRIDDLDTDVTIDRDAFGIGEDNNILDPAEGDLVNVKHTLALLEGLNLTIATVVPTEDETLVDWLKQDYLSVGADYALEGVGTIGVGALLNKDYVAVDDALIVPLGSLVEAPTLHIANFANWGVHGDNIVWGPGFWLDANLGEILGEGMDLFAWADARLGSFVDNEDSEANDDGVFEVEIGRVTKLNLGAEFGMQLNEALKISAAGRFGMGLGYDYEAVAGDSWGDLVKDPVDNDDNYVASNFNEGNWLRHNVYDITTLEANVRADMTLSETLSVWGMNKFHLNNIDLTQRFDDGGFAFGAETVDNVYGYASTNTVELGFDAVASERTNFKMSLAYDLFLGTPSASDLYADGASEDDEAFVDAYYGEWKSLNFNPWRLSAEWVYSY
ncbi:hypothetical protein [Spirochaeta africana]|uniref:DUF5723 domain-containing protein n=1 Tax=Spirochaeta africana (strain ATCC 700263 / DSM 8902 / Z-7692) TaxID=889378 RepID=H9UGY6_SPIAZ|nr:hypothetical protein [Spirochaeta africana]AFG36779.1 hypothetical protein Spiaf_0679 [Spirochaeta africana DSM 8902]